jgi:hypothetical protein
MTLYHRTGISVRNKYVVKDNMVNEHDMAAIGAEIAETSWHYVFHQNLCVDLLGDNRILW